MRALILKYKNFLLILFTIVSILSLFETISKGLKNSMDFQWHPSKLFWEGINHYKYFLEGGKCLWLKAVNTDMHCRLYYIHSHL